MASYSFTQEQIDDRVRRDRRTRLVFCIIAATVIIASCLLGYFRPELFYASSHFWVHWPVIALVVLANPLVKNLWNWRVRPAKVRKCLNETSAFITADAVVALYPTKIKKTVPLNEIIRAEEPSLGSGIYLRTSNRYRFLVLRRFEGYEQLKTELAEAHIPFVKTIVPPNLEEFLGVILFAGIIACALFSRNAILLTLNSLASILLSSGWFWILMRADLETFGTQRRRWMKAFAFFPAAIAGIALWISVR
jgi:hypothetical protein